MEITDTNGNISEYEQEIRDITDNFHSELGDLSDDVLKPKVPINDFIEQEKNADKGDKEIAISLIKAGYEWDDLINSSLKAYIKKIKNEIVDYSLRPQIFRFENEQEIDEKFLSIIKESLDRGISIFDVVLDMPLKRTITMEDIKYGEKKIREKSPDANYRIDLSGLILADLDWSDSREVFNYLKFDDKTFSKTSKEHLPEGFDPKEVFEKGKTIGLGIDDVHKMGYTGKGISVAICDWQLKPHNDIKTKEYEVEKHAKETDEYFHASAVSSILVGKQTGIAPESNLYFFAEKQDSKEKNGGTDLLSAFNKILEKNKELPDNEKIRVISISGPLYGEGIKKVVKELEDSGVWVLHSGEFWKDFGYLEKKDPMGDANDFNNYQHYIRRPDALYVNSGNRTVADPKNPTAYRHDTQACASWAIPVVAGYYVLACQADPTMTPKKFKKLARETSHEIDSTIRYEKDGKLIRSTETRKIKVIDIKALIQKIEEEKNK